MLVVGVTQGPLATHPTVEERVGALARTTGSMVLDSGPRLDTRSPQLKQQSAFGRRLDPKFERIAILAEDPKQRGFWGAFWSARDPNRNFLSLDRKGMIVMAIALVGIGVVYHQRLTQPQEAMKLFDFGTLRGWNGLGRTYQGCVLGFNNTQKDWEACDQAAANAAHLFDHIPGAKAANIGMDNYTTRNQRAQRETKTAIKRGCFDSRWDGHSPGQHPPNELSTYLRFGPEGASKIRATSSGPELDKQLKTYVSTRLLLLDNSAHFFGESGLVAFNRAVDTAEHRDVLAMLAERAKDPKFAEKEFPSERANIALLAEKGLALRPCNSSKTRG